MYEPNDDELAEFIYLQKTIKLLTQRLESLKELCKIRGTFCTKNHVCIVTKQTQERLAGLDEVVKVFSRETLDQYNLVKQLEFLIVKVDKIDKLKAGNG